MNYSSSITRVNSNFSQSLHNQSHTNYMSSVSASATLNNDIIPSIDSSLITPITPVNDNQTEPLTSSLISSYNASISSNIDTTNTPGIDSNSNNIFKSYDIHEENDLDLNAYFDNINLNNKSNDDIGLSDAVFGELNNSLSLFSSNSPNKTKIEDSTYKSLLLGNYKNETDEIAKEISLTESEKINLQSTFKEMEDYQRSIKQRQSGGSNSQKSTLDDLLKTDFNKFVVGDENSSNISTTTITKILDSEENKEKQEENDNKSNNNNKNHNLTIPILDTEFVDKEPEMKTPTKINERRNEDKDLLEMIRDELLLKGSYSSTITGNNISSESPSSTYNTTDLSTPTVTMRTNISNAWNHPFLKNSRSSNLTGNSSPFTLQSAVTPQSGITLKNQVSNASLSTPPTKQSLKNSTVPYQSLPVRNYDLSIVQPQEYQQESFSIVSPNSLGLENITESKSQSNIMFLSSFGVINRDSDLKGSINIGNSEAVTLGSSISKDAEAIISPVNPFLTFGDGQKVIRPDENEGYRGQMILTDIKDELNFNSFTSSFSSLNDSKSKISPIEPPKPKKEDDKKKKEDDKKKKKMEFKKRKEEKKKKEEEKKKKKREEKLLKEEKKKKNGNKNEKPKKNIFMFNEDKNSMESLKDKININKASVDDIKSKLEENKKSSISSLREMLFNDERKKESISSIKDLSLLSKSDSNVNKYAFLEDYITNLNAKNAYPVITSSIQTPPHSPLNPSKRGSDMAKIVNQRKSLLASLPSPTCPPTDFSLSLSPTKFFMKRSSLIQGEDPDMDMTNPEIIPHRFSSVSPRTRPIHPPSDEEDIPLRLSSVSPKTRPISRTSTSLRYSINSMMSNFNLPTSLSLVEGGILAPDSPSLMIKEKQSALTTKPSNDSNSLRSKSSFTNSYRSFSSELDHNLKKQQKYHQQPKNRHNRVGSNGSFSTTTTTNTNSPSHRPDSRFGHRKENDTDSIESCESFSSELNESLKRQKRRSRVVPTGHKSPNPNGRNSPNPNGRISPNTEAIEIKPQGSPYSNINSLNDLLYIKEYNSEKNNSDFKVNKSRFSSSSYNLNVPATRKYGENRLSYYSVRQANRNSISQYSNTTTDTNENNLDFESFVEDLMHTKHHQKYDHDTDIESKNPLGSSPKSSSEKRSKSSPLVSSKEDFNSDTIRKEGNNHETATNEMVTETALLNKDKITASPEMNVSKSSPSLKISTNILKEEGSVKTASPSSPFTSLSKVSVNSNGDPTFSKRTTSLMNKKQREQLETIGKMALNKEFSSPKNSLKTMGGLEDIKEDDSFVIPPKPSVQVNDYKSSHQKNPSITSQSSLESNSSRSSRNSAKRQAIYSKRTSTTSQLSHSSRQVNARNPRASILKTSTTDSSDTHSPTPSSASKRVSISEKLQRIEYSYGRDRSFSLNASLNNSPRENRLSHLSESNVHSDPQADAQTDSLPRPKKIEYTNIYPKRSSMVTNIGYGTLRSNSSATNSLGSSSKTSESHKSNNRTSFTSSLSHPRKIDYAIKRSSLSTNVTSLSSLNRPKKIEYRSSLLSSSGTGTSSLNRPVKIEYLKKNNRNSIGITTSSTSSGYAPTSSSATKLSKEDANNKFNSNKAVLRYGIDSTNPSPTKETNTGLEKIKENEILDNSAEDSFLLQCSLTSTSIDRLNVSFSKDTNINQSFSFSSLSGVAEYLNAKNNNIKAMIEKSKPLYTKDGNSFTTSVATSSVVPPSGIIIGPDDLKERKIFSLSGNSSGYSSSYSTVSRFNQTISFASVSSIPDSAINRNVKRVSCINLGLSSSSSSASSSLGRHRHTFSTHVCISDFDSITSMSSGFKDHIRNVMSPSLMAQEAQNLDDANVKNSSNSKSNSSSGSGSGSTPLKNILDESMMDKEEESFANSSASSIMKPYIPGFDNRNKSLSFSSSHLSSSIYNFINKETLENQRLYLQSKKANVSSDEANLNANTSSSNALNSNDIIPPFNVMHSNKVNNFRKSDIFNINNSGKSQRHGNKYHSIATSNGYLTYLSEGENSFNNDSLLSNFSMDDLMHEASQTSTQAAEVNPPNGDNSYFSLNTSQPQFDTLKSTIPGAPSISILNTHDPNQSHSSLRKITFDDSCDLTNSASHKAIKFKSSDTEDLPSLVTAETQSEGPKPTRIKELARQRMSMFNEINAILDRLCISNMSAEMDQRALPSMKFKTINNFTHSLGGSSSGSSIETPYQPFFYNNLDNTSEVTSLYHVMTNDQAPVQESDSESDSESEAQVKADNPVINPVTVPELPVPELPVITLENKVIDTDAIAGKAKNEKVVKNKKSRGFMAFGKGLKKFKSFITGSNSNKKKKVPMRVRTSSIYMDPEGRGVQYSIEKVILCDEDDNNENTDFPDTVNKNQKNI